MYALKQSFLWEIIQNLKIQGVHSTRNKAKKYAKQLAFQLNHKRLIEPFTIKLLAVKTSKTTFYNDQPRYNINKQSKYVKVYDKFIKTNSQSKLNEDTMAKKQKSPEPDEETTSK